MTMTMKSTRRERLRFTTPSMRSANMSFLSIIVFFALLQIAFADNTTLIPFDTIIPSLEYFAIDAVQMESAGFLDLAELKFTRLDKDEEAKAIIIDLAVFAMPGNVGGNVTDSILQSVGISSGDYVCCSAAAQKDGACTSTYDGRLIVDEDAFDGVWLSVTIHAYGSNTSTINPYEFDPVLNVEKRGYYALMFANCNEEATSIQITGDSFWVSFFTDEEIENSVPIYIGLTMAYLCLVLWFGYLMHVNQSSRVRIEVYILVTILLGFAETGLETIYYANESKHITWLAIITEFFDTTKKGVSRCLLMMLSQGWGVTVATLERNQMVPIVILATAYMLLNFVFDVTTILEGARVEEGDEDDDDEGTIGTVRWILTYVDAVIWYWIPTAMCNTMKYLQENRQERKLQRYRWLLGIMLFALVLNILAFLFVTMEIASNLTVNITIWPEVNEAGFLLTLICVAILWRPNPQAREYAYVSELSPNDEVFDLELTEVSSTALPVAVNDEDMASHREETVTDRQFT